MKKKWSKTFYLSGLVLVLYSVKKATVFKGPAKIIQFPKSHVNGLKFYKFQFHFSSISKNY